MSDFSRDDLVREFGEPGVHNPNVLDLIHWDDEVERVVLVMIEKRPWGTMSQLRELEEKINRYLGFALDGFLVEQFPQYEGKPVEVRLDCAHEPEGDAVDLLREAQAAVEGEGLFFGVHVGDGEEE